MMFLFFYNVKSERELMQTIPERLDWMWFLGYDLDDEIPNHIVLSKARKKWGVQIFKSFFKKVVSCFVEARLVDGKKIYCDASLVDADALKDSVVNKEKLERYQKLEEELEDYDKQYVSTTDPEASVIKRKNGKAKLRYKKT